MVYRRVVKVSDEVFEELRRLEGELGLPSPNQVIKHLLSQYSKQAGDPLRQYVTCRARKAGGAYFVECSDGRKAFVPEDVLAELAERFGDVVEVTG